MRLFFSLCLLILASCSIDIDSEPSDTADNFAVPTNANDIRPLLPGQMAPRFETTDAYGKAFVYDPTARERPAVIIFYRGGWCPKCNLYWADLRTIEDELVRMDLDIIFVSADSTSVLADAVADENNLPAYHLLSDASSQIAQDFGIAFRLDDRTYQKYVDVGLVDLEKASGYEHHNLPAPAVFIMDAAGVIKFSYVNPDYSVRLHPQVLLAAAKSMPGYRIMRQKK